MAFKIEKITAFVVTDEDGTEGIPAFSDPNGLMQPMVGADPARVKALYPIAIQLCATFGKEFRVLEFTNRVDITDEMRKSQPGVS